MHYHHSQVEEDPSSIYGIIHPDAKADDVPGGVILAHSMGLGKTLTTIAFLHTYFAAARASSLRKAVGQGGSGTSSESTGCGRALLVVPANVQETFFAEFATWLPKGAESASSPLTVEKVSFAPPANGLIRVGRRRKGKQVFSTRQK